jgi:hypothetical protein
MTDADRPQFAHLMAVLAETFDATISTVRVEAYFRALGDLDWAVVERAGLALLKQARRFPLPAEMREMAARVAAFEHARRSRAFWRAHAEARLQLPGGRNA